MGEKQGKSTDICINLHSHILEILWMGEGFTFVQSIQDL